MKTTIKQWSVLSTASGYFRVERSGVNQRFNFWGLEGKQEAEQLAALLNHQERKILKLKNKVQDVV